MITDCLQGRKDEKVQGLNCGERQELRRVQAGLCRRALAAAVSVVARFLPATCFLSQLRSLFPAPYLQKRWENHKRLP